jgi:hypothetical protein
VVSLGKWVQDGGLQLLDRNLIMDNVTGEQHEQSLLLFYWYREYLSSAGKQLMQKSESSNLGQ